MREYKERDLASRLNDLTYGLYLKARMEVVEVNTQRTCWREAETRMARMRDEMNKLFLQCKDAQEARVYTHRIYIIDNILTLKCPRAECRQAVFDFSG